MSPSQTWCAAAVMRAYNVSTPLALARLRSPKDTVTEGAASGVAPCAALARPTAMQAVTAASIEPCQRSLNFVLVMSFSRCVGWNVLDRGSVLGPWIALLRGV